MSAFNAGRAGEASERLARFLERYPRDPRAEDAAYVRILALRRAGDSAAARAAARHYLERYPGGFRHDEVQALAR
jgi:outer membrane protein assembly factor BamD (BamD/ComL family)